MLRTKPLSDDDKYAMEVVSSDMDMIISDLFLEYTCPYKRYEKDHKVATVIEREFPCPEDKEFCSICHGQDCWRKLGRHWLWR